MTIFRFGSAIVGSLTGLVFTMTGRWEVIAVGFLSYIIGLVDGDSK